MIRNISQKQDGKKIVKKNTQKELEQIYKLVLLLHHLEVDLSLLQDEKLISFNDVASINYINKSTDQLNGQRKEEKKKTLKTQKQQQTQQEIQTLEQETQYLCKDFFDQCQRNKKKRRL
ncbi:unnamed protein product [Paramecium sonneborni]|uniref:Uncharacterized protein n=1 Tax=Paramecium sonneborni TaxID=65129 RepID=A0A8S1QJ59_9CILI|nr:unnamed protein product [Paramecium sonneborni]